MRTSANVLFNRTCRVHQVNPALTLALLATRRLDVLRALVYIAAQCLGACLGAGALYLALPLKTTAEHFVNKVSGSRDLPAGSGSSAPLPPPQVPMQLNAGQALGVEVLCTFQMVFTVFSVEEQRRRENPEPGNLAIGLAHSAGVLLGVRSPHGTCSMVFRIRRVRSPSGPVLRRKHEPCAIPGSSHRRWLLGEPLGEKASGLDR